MTTAPPPPRSTARRLLVPREHGAWAQMALPLAAGLFVGGPTWPAVLLALTTVLDFVAHEPALVLLGNRGARVRDEDGPRARRQLVVLAVAAAACLVAGVAWAPWPARWALGGAAACSAVVGALAVKKNERSMPGEFAVIGAFVSAGTAVAFAAGASAVVAATLSVTWALAFGSSVFAVHVVLASARSKGLADVGVRHAVLTTILTVGGSVLALELGLGWVVPAAVAPMALVSLTVCLSRWSAKHLHRMGWGLAASSTLTLVLLVLGLTRR